MNKTMLLISGLQAVAAIESACKKQWNMALVYICFSVSGFVLAGVK